MDLEPVARVQMESLRQDLYIQELLRAVRFNQLDVGRFSDFPALPDACHRYCIRNGALLTLDGQVARLTNTPQHRVVYLRYETDSRNNQTGLIIAHRAQPVYLTFKDRWILRQDLNTRQRRSLNFSDDRDRDIGHGIFDTP